MFNVSSTFELKKLKAFDKFPQDKIDVIYYRVMQQIADKAEELYIENVPYGSGDKPGYWSIHNAVEQGDIEKKGRIFSVEVGIRPIYDAAEDDEDPEYPRYVDEGTGIYNLKKGASGKLFVRSGTKAGNFSSKNSALITPTNKEVMVFHWPRHGTVFAKYTRGQRGQHYSDKINSQMRLYIRAQKRKIKQLVAAVAERGLFDRE